MLKISGFGNLKRALEDARAAMGELSGELGLVKFDPSDPASIEAAIQDMELIVDQKLGLYASNPIILRMAAALKAKYREGLVERAAAARLTRD